MAKTSIIIPSRNEKFLVQTVNDLFRNATGEMEVIVVLDGYWEANLPDDKRLRVIHRGKARGMRDGINSAVAISSGEFLMKCDAHCAFAHGFDDVLKEDCADNWIVIPRRYALDAEKWERAPKSPVDAMYYFYPYLHPDDLGLHGRPWMERAQERKEVLIDEDVTFQGSAWFMNRRHWDRIGGMSEAGYETFMGEPQELGFKTQLGPWGGSVMRNKKTWYAHLHKGRQYGRMYSFSGSERTRGNAHSFDFWWNNRWEGRVHDIEWLIENFPPMPGWPVNWKELKNEKVPPLQ